MSDVKASLVTELCRGTLTIAVLSQFTILTLSILAWTKVITYFLAIAIIHALMGFIVAINFVCAVYVVHEQQLDII